MIAGGERARVKLAARVVGARPGVAREAAPAMAMAPLGVREPWQPVSLGPAVGHDFAQLRKM